MKPMLKAPITKLLKLMYDEPLSTLLSIPSCATTLRCSVGCSSNTGLGAAGCGIKLELRKCAWFQRLKVNRDEPFSNAAFNLNLRHCNWGYEWDWQVCANAAAGGHLVGRRGLTSSTYQLNVSAFGGTRGI